MDEAERCHDVAFIVAGRLIVRGTADQVIAASALVTYQAEGERADRLAAQLAQAPGVLMAAPFGEGLHVSGIDRAALEAAIAPYRRPPYRWAETRPTLEDVFIHMMGTSGANNDAGPPP
jgi:ABC-2 type transport system ATP-binding protein